MLEDTTADRHGTTIYLISYMLKILHTLALIVTLLSGRGYDLLSTDGQTQSKD